MRRYRTPGRCLSVFIMVLLLIGIYSSGVWGADDDDIEIIDYDFSVDSIEVGDYFTLDLDIQNGSGSDIEKVSMEVDSSSFKEIDREMNWKKLDAGDMDEIWLQLLCVDESGTIPLKFNYEIDDDETSLTKYVYIRVEDEDEEDDTGVNDKPVFAVQGNQVISAAAGEALELDLRIKNVSSISASDVSIKASFADTDAPFSFTDDSTFYYQTWSGNSTKTITLNIDTDITAQTGTYEILLEYDYTNRGSYDFSDSETVKLKVGQATPPSRLIFTPKTEDQILAKDEPFTLTISAVNHGGLTARNISVSLGGLSSDGIVLASGSTRQYIEQLLAGQERFIYYNIKPVSDLKDGSYPLTLSISYTDEAGSSVTDEQEIFLEVEGSGGSFAGTPKIIINRYESSPVIVQAGSNFTLNMSFLNTHRSKTIQNIKVILTVNETSSETTGSVFSPVKASNTLYIDEIKPQETAARSLNFYTVPDADPRTYSITAAMEYQDEEGTEYKTEEIIGIPVKQVSRLEIGNIQVYGGSPLGQPVPISCELYNTGKTKLSNLMVKLEGPFDTENNTTFIGNMESGNMEYYDATIIPNESGELNGTLVFSYEDVSAEPVLITRDFSFEVIDFDPAMEMMNPQDMPEELQSGFVIKPWYYAFPAVILAVIVVVIVVRRRKKRQEEEMALDE